ncbi:MAG TPA: energy-coupling factor transporter transmembrane protein EcfT [Thermotoga sp.]|nr:energy-coupling factor transporter transmembrane protein EcfT [Thermotoga sp.]
MKMNFVIVGRYIPKDTFIHNLDPRSKMIGVLILIVGTLTVPSLTFYIFPACLIAVLIVVSNVGFKPYLYGIKGIWFLILFAGLIQLFVIKEDKPLILGITMGGLLSAFYIIIRLILILLAAELLSFTTPPLMIAKALEKLFALVGLKNFGHELGMVTTIAMRFVPILALEADRIAKAQIARGASFERGRLSDRLKMIVVLTVPLFVSAIRKAEELAIAMESRLYGLNADRSSYIELLWKPFDTLFLMICFLPMFVNLLYFLAK